jgi:hypothetical protein
MDVQYPHFRQSIAIRVMLPRQAKLGRLTLHVIHRAGSAQMATMIGGWSGIDKVRWNDFASCALNKIDDSAVKQSASAAGFFYHRPSGIPSDVAGPALRGVESYDPNGIFVFAAYQIADDSIAIGRLFIGFSIRAAQLSKVVED